MKYPQVSVKQLVDDYVEDLGASQLELDEDLLYKWAADYVTKVFDDSIEQWSERIMILPVDNYSTMLPPDYKKIVQLSCVMEPMDVTSRWHVSQAIFQNVKGECDLEVNIKCPDCYQGVKEGGDCGDCNYYYIEVDVDTMWNEAHPELRFGHMKHYIGTSSMVQDINASTYHNQFRLMRPATGPYFNMEHYIPTCLNLNVESGPEYRIESSSKLVVNFEKGTVLISYLGVDLDEHGNVLAPNIPLMYESVSYYLSEKRFWQEFIRTQRTESYNGFLVSQQQRMRTMALLKDRLDTSLDDMHRFWEEAKKYWWNRLGRPFDKSPL